MDGQQHKKKSTKSRNGCVNCKRRRVKCDEGHPACSKCRSRGDACAYNTPQAWVFHPASAGAGLAAATAAAARSHSPPAPQQSLSSPMLDPSSDYSIHFFRHGITQFADCPGWTQDGCWFNLATVMKHRMQQTSVMCMLNALTTSWRASWDLSWAHNPQYETYYQQSLQKGVRFVIDSGQMGKPVAATMITSCMVAVGEMIRTADVNMPGPHFRATQRQLNQLADEYKTAEEDEKTEIGKLLQIVPLVMTGSRQFYDLPQADFTTRSPYMAADILDSILRYWVIGLTRLEHIGKSWIEAPEPSVVWGMLESWRASFQHFRKSITAHESCSEDVTRFVMMHFFVGQLIVRAATHFSRKTIAPPLSLFDPAEDTRLFDRIVDLAESLILSGSIYKIGKNYTRYMGLIQPIFFCALRGSTKEIRRRATLLLSSIPYSEGDWNTRIAYRVAETMCSVFDSSTVPDVDYDPRTVFVIDSANCTFQTQDTQLQSVTLELKYAMVHDILSPQRIWQRKTSTYWDPRDLESFRMVSWPLTFTVKTFGYLKSDAIPYMHGITDTALRHLCDSKQREKLEQSYEYRPASRFADWDSALVGKAPPPPPPPPPPHVKSSSTSPASSSSWTAAPARATEVRRPY